MFAKSCLSTINLLRIFLFSELLIGDNKEKKMAAKQRFPQRIKPMNVSKTEFDLPPKNSSSTKSATPGRIRPKTVPAKTLLKEKGRSKLSSAEKKSEIRTYTGQTYPAKPVNGLNANGNARLSNPSAIKPVNGDYSEESNEKTTVRFTDKKNSEEIDRSSDSKSQIDLRVVVHVETKDYINVVQQEFEDPDDSSNDVEAVVNLKQTKYESSEKEIEETTVKSETREKEEHIAEHPESPESELNYKNKNSEFPDRDLNSRHNDSDRTSMNKKEASIEEHNIIKSSESDVMRCFSSAAESDVTTPWIGGLAIVRSGDVICLDLNNERIKRFDKKFSMVFSIEIPFACSGMIVTSNDEIAVTCLNEIHFYNVGKFGMNRTAKYYTINGMAHGIAHDQNWFALTCDITEPDDSTIRIIDDTGSESYVITPPIVSGLSLKLGSFIEIDRTLECVFLSESAPSRVVCLNFDGEALWDTAIPGGARGLISIDTDDLLVCDQFSEKVRLLSKHGVLKTTVISSEDGLYNPDLVARKPDTNDIIVSFRGFGSIGLITIYLTPISRE